MGAGALGVLFGVKSDKIVRGKLRKLHRVIVDARSKELFEKGHMNDAISIPVGGPLSSNSKADAAVTAVFPSLPADKSTPIVVHCTLGGEANVCRKALERAGFTDVTNGGGLDSVKILSVASSSSRFMADCRNDTLNFESGEGGKFS